MPFVLSTIAARTALGKAKLECQSRPGRISMNDDGWAALLPPLLQSAGLPHEGFSVEPLTGGVSSDIVRIVLADGRLACAKRALRKLKVATDWQAPLERNHYEIAWLRRAAAIVPGAAPKVLGEDPVRGIALLEYLPPADYSLWKADLLAGHADPQVAVRVADTIGRIHAATLRDAAVAAEFPTDHLIDALRYDPYLRFLAGRHADLSASILSTLERSFRSKLALVHGDVSPKNILVRTADGQPVLLDAECAWYGDPAFDAAFCLNHLLLKSIHLPDIAPELRQQARDFADTWLSHFPADLRAMLDDRAAALLPCLMLARVDGKSPVEYLSSDSRETVRRISIPMIAKPFTRLAQVIDSVH
ncbi:MAG: aminoglycoside phosphotransferase family protein [Hyphomicrobiales bacterium]|nr:MAG: aminoglycoside phosphotransferase family protein [Hyphomicrobiales bacterium]